MSFPPRLEVVFYQTSTGREPVRTWLKSISREDRRVIGEDIKTVQFAWPIGMPLVRKLNSDLWEVRSQLSHNIARVIFTLHGDYMVLIHGFFKKTQKTSKSDLALAQKRLSNLRGGK